MIRLRLWLWLAVSAATACVSVDEQIAADAAGVRAAAADRLGIAAAEQPIEPADGAVLDEVQQLLADGLTEAEAVKIALLNNRDLRAAYEGLGIARGELLQAGLLTNPVFSADAKFFRNATEIELGLAQSFLDLFYAPLRRRVAAAEFAARQALTTATIIRLVYDVRRGFVAVRAAQQMVELYEQVHQAALASFELMQRLHQAGNVTDPQLTADEAALARARIDLAAASSHAQDVREPINVLLGLWGAATEWRLDGRLNDDVAVGLDFEHVERRAVAASLDLAANQATAEAAAQRAGLASWEGWFATGELGVVAKRETSGLWGLGPGAAWSLPLFHQGQGHRAAAVAELRATLHHHAALAVEIRAAARQFRQRAKSLEERVRYFGRVYVPLRARLVRETLQNYHAMQVGAFDVFLARQQQVAASREYLETLRDAWIARFDLEELLGGSLNHGRRAVSPTAPMSATESMSPKEH